MREADAGRRHDAVEVAPAGSSWAAFRRGIREFPLVPGVILLSAIMGFGALARDMGLDLGVTVFTTAAIFALPGQVALITEQANDATLLASALAVLLTATRLLPMAVVLAPYLRGSRLPGPFLVLAMHFCAVTLWVTGMRRLPEIPPAERLPYFLGSALPLYVLSLAATALGFLIAGEVPVLIAAALLFLTPIYFVLSMIQSAKASPADKLAILLGLLLGPLFATTTPGFDLLLAGAVGGIGAHAAVRWWGSP